jgi:WD40 repeat protein
MKSFVHLSAAVFCFFLSSVVSADSPTVTFDDHIKPIFRQHCFACHNQDEQKGGLALDSYSSVVEGGGSGEIVFDDGDVDGSRLWQLMNHDDTPEMPPNQDKIAEDQLMMVRHWIESGIIENLGSKSNPKKKKNSLAFVAGSGGRPDGRGAMPKFRSFHSPVVTDRPAAVTAIATSPWAPLVAIAGQEQIVLYHTETAELLGIIPFDEGIAQGLRFSRDGKFLVASGGEHSVNGIVVVYDIQTGKRVAEVGDELDIVFDADANRTMTQIALGGPKKLLRIFDAVDGSKLFELKKHTDWIYAVAYSPDGVLVASGDRSGGLCVWEAKTGRLYLDLTDHKDAVHGLAWRDDSNVLASASADGTVKLWDMNQGKAVKSISVGKAVHDVSFDHQGRIVTGGQDKQAKLWDASGKHLHDFSGMAESILEVEISHDGGHVVYGDWTGAVVLVSTNDPKQMASLAANPRPIDQRIASLKKQIDSMQREVQLAKGRLDHANVAADQSKRQVDRLRIKISAVQTHADTANDKLGELQQRLATHDLEIPKLVASSRHTQDQLIAARIDFAEIPRSKTSTSGQIAQSKIAVIEQSLADLLSVISTKRKNRIEIEKQSKELHLQISRQKQQMESLGKTLSELEKKAKKALDARQSADLGLRQLRQQIDEKRLRYNLMIADGP